MDPWAEAGWLTRFRALAAGQTALLITHRFTAARHADTIHVLEAGQVVESGTHTELLSQNGRYATCGSRKLRSAGARMLHVGHGAR